MPRGRKKINPESIDEKITRLTAEIDKMTVTLKEKKKELKKAIKDKTDEEKRIAEKAAEEEKAKIIDAVQNAVSSGEKTLDEILEFLK